MPEKAEKRVVGGEGVFLDPVFPTPSVILFHFTLFALVLVDTSYCDNGRVTHESGVTEDQWSAVIVVKQFGQE